jgi:ABC-type transport system involved in multi-copper enzyme maturation permease subunit
MAEEGGRGNPMSGLARGARPGIMRGVESAPLDDLPDRFGAMLVKELRQNMRRGSFVHPFLGIQLLAVLALLAEFQDGSQASFERFSGMLNLAMLGGAGPFWWVVMLVGALVMPLGGLVLMGQELEEGNHELLLLTKLNRWKVVGGKFLTLWGLCVLTFVSLLPYVIVRYNVGAIEVIDELALSLSVISLSAMICAGAIGASSFQGLLARTTVMLLFIGSMLFGCGIPLAAAAGVSGKCGVFYHFNAVAATGCYVLLGLSLARSRLRLVVHAYEVKPSFMVVGLLLFAPFVIAMTTAMTGGYAGFVGLVGMALVGFFADATPKAPPWVKPPAPNIPPPMPGGAV